MNGKQLIERIERLVMGATAEERVNLMAELAAQRAAAVVEARIVAALERLADEVYDEPRQCPQCGLWEVYGTSSLCDVCRPDHEEGKEGSDG
ncbi:MAG TPA: hypothetical protein VID72_14030 [Ktedonobacterales bacterium]|jgi:hypothetical protein